jgi:phospholipid/cholesterol/gamma-HCH transport system substrate-binding protein
MRRVAVQARRHGRSLALLLGLAVIGTAAGFYVLLQQRLPNPFENFYAVNAAFPTAAGVVPGLGEPVNVVGVHVGAINGVSLMDGIAILHMDINSAEMPRLYRNASAELVPNTPLGDMEVDIQPGDRSAGVLPHGATIPCSQTTSPIDSDELLDVLDTDTRTWLTSLITNINEGTEGRSGDIRALLGNLTPTATQLHELGDLLAGRRHVIAAIVRNLGLLAAAVSSKDTQLRTVVVAGNRTLSALASQDVALRDSITHLPGTLQTARTTLANVATLANALGPTATALLPTARRLPATLRDARVLFQGAALLPLKQIPPFVDAVLPLATRLPAIAHSLAAATPPLIASFKVLAYTTNELAYNGGKNPGFLYWLAWGAHNADSVVSTEDAQGAVLRGTAVASCATLRGSTIGPLLETLFGSLGC